jgi:mRNA interferase YafQ
VIRPLIHTATFDRAARGAGRRNAVVAAAIAEALTRLEADAFDARLGTHKVSGDMADYWAASAGYDLRIVFRFVDVGGVASILLVTCGTHDEVY